MDADKKKKKSIIQISNSDDLCCARAIVTMRAYCHRDEGVNGLREWKNTRKGDVGGRNTLLLRAKELHNLSGVPEGPCGIPEKERFQKSLTPTYELMVICRSRPFNIVFRGSEAPNVIRLIKANEHYDGCTSFSGFLQPLLWRRLLTATFHQEDMLNTKDMPEMLCFIQKEER